MTLTLSVSERVAARLARLANAEVAAIGQKLVSQGASGVASVLGELREVMELVTQLEAAGVRVRKDGAPVTAAPRPVHPPAPAADADDVSLEDADDAPPPAVLAARGRGGRAARMAGGDAFSGP